MDYVNRWLLLTESYVRTLKIGLPRWGNAVNLRIIDSLDKMQYRRCPLITRCGGSFSQEKPGFLVQAPLLVLLFDI